MNPIEIINLDTTDSTQTRAKELLKSGGKTAPFCIVAEAQTGGYGQAGRAYYCPRGGLYMTLVLCEQDFAYKFAAGFTAVCVADVITNLTDLNPTIKWINDIMLDGKKIGGVLVEKVSNNFIIGVGLNLVQTEPIPDHLKNRIGFLFPRAKNPPLTTHNLAHAIIHKITSTKLTDEQVLAAYKQYCDIVNLNIDGSIDIIIDGRVTKKFNNL